MEKNAAIHRSIQNHWLALTIFTWGGLGSLLEVLADLNWFSGIFAALAWGMLYCCVAQLIELYRFRKAFHGDPLTYHERDFPKPVLFRAVYWIVPKW